MEAGIIEVRKSHHTKKERLALNEKVQRQRQRITHLENEIESLGGAKGIAELKRIAKNFELEIKKLKDGYEAQISCLKKDFQIATKRYEFAEEREVKLERRLEDIRKIATKGSK